jgi:hypothetical protein
VVTIGAANIHEGTKLLISLMESISIETGAQAKEKTEDGVRRYEICDPVEQVLSISTESRSDLQIPDPPQKTKKKRSGRPRRFDKEETYQPRSQIQRGEILRLARELQKDRDEVREETEDVPRPDLSRLYPHTMEGIEMSSESSQDRPEQEARD